jgi:hypothetical protein
MEFKDCVHWKLLESLRKPSMVPGNWSRPLGALVPHQTSYNPLHRFDVLTNTEYLPIHIIHLHEYNIP